MLSSRRVTDGIPPKISDLALEGLLHLRDRDLGHGLRADCFCNIHPALGQKIEKPFVFTITMGLKELSLRVKNVCKFLEVGHDVVSEEGRIGDHLIDSCLRRR